MSRPLILRPSAKINLNLSVGPRLATGFHEVRTLLQSVAVTDTLTLTPRRGAFALLSRTPGVPADRTNLVWRAADALWRALGRAGEAADVHVKLEKTIPTGAGLGGGSADAAAALLGLNRLWSGGQSVDALMRLGATLGSDVPFFFQGGTAIGLGRGEDVYPVDDVRRLGIVLIKPSVAVSAADAYRWLDEDRTRGAVEPEHARVSTLDVGWARTVSLANDLEAAVGRRHPVVHEMIDTCLRAGAIAAAMTGSGSAVFGVFSEAAARRAIGRLRRPDWLVLLTRTVTRHEAARRLAI